MFSRPPLFKSGTVVTILIKLFSESLGRVRRRKYTYLIWMPPLALYFDWLSICNREALKFNVIHHSCCRAYEKERPQMIRND